MNGGTACRAVTARVEKGGLHTETKVTGGQQARAAQRRPGSGVNVQRLVRMLCLLTASVSHVTGSCRSQHIRLSHTSRGLAASPQLLTNLARFDCLIAGNPPKPEFNNIISTDIVGLF